MGEDMLITLIKLLEEQEQIRVEFKVERSKDAVIPTSDTSSK